MKKILVLLILFLLSFNLTNADFSEFIKSPNENNLNQIKDIKTRYCEAVFLRAYMRREFSDFENRKCRNIFARKIEAEMDYKKYVFKERGIY